MRHLSTLLLCLTFLSHGLCGQCADAPNWLEWEEVAQLPPWGEQTESLGVAGAFVGVDGDMLIVAGGSQYITPSEVFHNTAKALVRELNAEEQGKMTYRWIDLSPSLPYPVAYGMSVSTEWGVVCIGGRNRENIFGKVLDKVFLMDADASGVLKITTLPSLPSPCAYGSAAILNGKIYVAGGRQKMPGDNIIWYTNLVRNFWSFDFSLFMTEGSDAEVKWEAVMPWPGRARYGNLLVAQHNGIHDCLYFMGGDDDLSGPIYTDVYEFSPAQYDPTAYDAKTNTYSGKNRHANPWRRCKDAPRPIFPGAGIALGLSHISILSRDGTRIPDEAPFSTLFYNTITDAWSEADRLPLNSEGRPINQFGTTPVKWGNSIFLASGKQGKNGKYTPEVWRISAENSSEQLGVHDPGKTSAASSMHGESVDAPNWLEWEEVAQLPPWGEQTESLGVAGAFVGVDGDMLIVAGGAIFPPSGGEVFQDTAKALVREPSKGDKEKTTYRWIDLSPSLPYPVAYGMNVSTEWGVVCMGGYNRKYPPHYEELDKVFLMNANVFGVLKITMLPSLPAPCFDGSSAILNGKVYVAGGQQHIPGDDVWRIPLARNFWSFDLSRYMEEGPDADVKWEVLKPWPGPARFGNLLVAQHNGVKDCLYVIGGREDGFEGEFLSDTYEFSPAQYDPTVYDAKTNVYLGKNGRANPWRRCKDAPCPIHSGAGIAQGLNHISILSGHGGKVHCKAPFATLFYNTIADTWAEVERLPLKSDGRPIAQLSTTPVQWGDSIFLASGNVRGSGEYAPEVWRISLDSTISKSDVYDSSTMSIASSVQKENAGTRNWMKWEEVSPLSSASERTEELGVDGAFVGIDGDILIVAGGRQDSKEDDVFLDTVKGLVQEPSPEDKKKKVYRWIDLSPSFPKTVAYGMSVSTEWGVVCMGGWSTGKVFDEAFLLDGDTSGSLTITPLPSLPSPCANGAAAFLNGKIYVAGGQSTTSRWSLMKNFWSFDLAKYMGGDEDPNIKWEVLMPWPGAARAYNMLVAQHNGINDCLYVMGGTVRGAVLSHQFLKQSTEVLEFSPTQYDAEAFDFAKGEYSGQNRYIEPWRKRKDAPRGFPNASGIALGQSHISVFCSMAGRNSSKVSENFSSGTLFYHTITDTWIESSVDRPTNEFATIPVKWGNDFFSVSKNVAEDGERVPRIWRISTVKSRVEFGALNYATIILYLLAMLGIGVFFSFRNKNTDDFFRGGKRIPWWVAGLSIFATMLSSITFVAIPAKAFATNWVYLVANLMIFAVAPIIIAYILPFFRQIDATTAYEYLEKRFNVVTRLFASACFILFQIGRMSVVLFLPSLALAAITPMTVIQCILIMGLLSIAYCTMGGLEAVVWTDTIQSFVLLGGAALCLGLIIVGLDGGASTFFSIAVADNKFQIANFDWDAMSYTTAAFWVVAIGGIGQSLVPYSSDQAVVQRYMSVPDQKQAARAIWTNAVLSIPASILFFGVGTALYVFYKTHPQELDPSFMTDAIFPLFISRELPVGVAGLVVAGIFAAAQSTVSTSMNSLSTAIVTDWVRRFDLLKTERSYLRLARMVTFLTGCMGTALAVALALSDIKSALDAYMKILGLFGGALCGLFLLGMFTRKANGTGAFIGAVLAAILTAWWGTAGVGPKVHGLLFASVGIVLCLIFGFGISLIVGHNGSIDGLTIHTIDRNKNV